MKKPHSLLILLMGTMLTLSACEQFNTPPPDVTPPVDTEPPVDTIEPVDPGDPFDVLEHAWTLEIRQGRHSAIAQPTVYVNDDGTMFFANRYFPGVENCDLGTQREVCQHNKLWVITADGEVKAEREIRIPESPSASRISVYSTAPAPDGDVYVVGGYGMDSTGFMQRYNADAEPVGPAIIANWVRHINFNDDRTVLFDAADAGIYRGTVVRALDLRSPTGSPEIIWEESVTNLRNVRYVVHNDGEVHLIVSEIATRPSEKPTEFIALDAATGAVLHKAVIPKPEPSEPDNIVLQTPTTLVVNDEGKTLMYTFTMERLPAGYIRMPYDHITEIIYDPETRTFTQTEIPILESHSFYADQHVYPVASPDGEIIITANTDIGVVLLAIKDSQVQWIHDLHEGPRDPPNYHPLALMHQPDYGYYIIGTYREDHRNVRDATYHIMRFTGMKGASSTN